MQPISNHTRLDPSLILYAYVLRLARQYISRTQFEESATEIIVSRSGIIKILHPDLYARIYLATIQLELFDLIQAKAREISHPQAEMLKIKITMR